MINKDEFTLKKVAIIWNKAGWRDKIANPEEMKCYGCYSNKNCGYGIKECCLKKDIDNCGKCHLYPCHKIEDMFERTKIYADKCKELLSSEEYELINKAFFLKKENLDKENISFLEKANK